MSEKNNSPERHLCLGDLVNVEEWQKIQDSFSAVTDVSLRTLDAEGKLFTVPSNQPRLCLDFLKNSTLHEKLCGSCLPTFLGGDAVVSANLSYVCYAGMHNFIAPLRINGGGVLGYLILGPVILVMRKAKEDYRRIAEEIGIDLEELWGAIVEIRTISLNGMSSLIELIRHIAEFILKLSYLNLTTEEQGQVMDASRLNRLLGALLEVAFQISGADIGSVMFLDKESNGLTIRSSRGIPEEVVKNTRVKIGEGIAGLAASEGKAFLVEENSSDNRIKRYLNRPYISSAMVVPIMIENYTQGVLNLGALRNSSVKFNPENLGQMQNLVKLATLAIEPLG